MIGLTTVLLQTRWRRLIVAATLVFVGAACTAQEPSHFTGWYPARTRYRDACTLSRECPQHFCVDQMRFELDYGLYRLNACEGIEFDSAVVGFPVEYAIRRVVADSLVVSSDSPPSETSSQDDNAVEIHWYDWASLSFCGRTSPMRRGYWHRCTVVFVEEETLQVHELRGGSVSLQGAPPEIVEIHDGVASIVR